MICKQLIQNNLHLATLKVSKLNCRFALHIVIFRLKCDFCIVFKMNGLHF